MKPRARKKQLPLQRTSKVATMTTMEALHRLIEDLPQDQAARLLDQLSDPVLRSLLTAPVVREPLTNEERAGLEEARAELARGEGLTTEQVLRELKR
jgi:hypothetical protein